MESRIRVSLQSREMYEEIHAESVLAYRRTHHNICVHCCAIMTLMGSNDSLHSANAGAWGERSHADKAIRVAATV